MDDKALATAAAGGDQQAFEQLVERYRGFIYTTAWKVLLHEDDALDVTQMVMIRISNQIGTWRGDGSFAAWVRTVTIRMALNERKRLSRVKESPAEDEELERAAAHHPPSHSAADVIELDQRRALVREAMHLLPKQQRAVLMLRLCEDMRPVDIARELDLPPTQVRSQLFRAIDRMKEIVTAKTGRNENRKSPETCTRTAKEPRNA